MWLPVPQQRLIAQLHFDSPQGPDLAISQQLGVPEDAVAALRLAIGESDSSAENLVGLSDQEWTERLPLPEQYGPEYHLDYVTLLEDSPGNRHARLLSALPPEFGRQPEPPFQFLPQSQQSVGERVEIDHTIHTLKLLKWSSEGPAKDYLKGVFAGFVKKTVMVGASETRLYIFAAVVPRSEFAFLQLANSCGRTELARCLQSAMEWARSAPQVSSRSRAMRAAAAAQLQTMCDAVSSAKAAPAAHRLFNNEPLKVFFVEPWLKRLLDRQTFATSGEVVDKLLAAVESFNNAPGLPCFFEGRTPFVPTSTRAKGGSA